MSTPATPQLPAYLRTYVPMIVLILGKELAKHGLNVDGDLLQLIVAGVMAAAYYALVRFLEQHKAQFGWLLGYAKQPLYVPGPAPAPDDGQAAVAEVVDPVVDPDPGLAPQIKNDGGGV